MSMRTDRKIHDAIQEMMDKVWYSRHFATLEEALPPKTLAGVRRSARQIEKKYGKKNLALDAFDIGMINGKLSALRWVIGGDWDELYI